MIYSGKHNDYYLNLIIAIVNYNFIEEGNFKISDAIKVVNESNSILADRVIVHIKPSFWLFIRQLNIVKKYFWIEVNSFIFFWIIGFSLPMIFFLEI
mgnify:CR=1 FL=1